MANARAVIDIDINTSSAAAGLRQLQSQINAFNSTLTKSSAVQATAMRNAKDNLMELVNASRFFTAESVKMTTGAAALDKTLTKGQVTLGQYFKSFQKGSLESARVMSLANTRAAALQTQFIATGAAANGMRDALAIRPLQAFNEASVVSAQKLAIQRAMLNQATTSMINFGKNTQWAGRQLMVGFTVPLSIFGAMAGKTFMDLEKQAVNFKKVYGDAFTTPEELNQNLNAVKELGAEFTKYGIAVKDTIGLAAEAAAAGAQNKDLIDATTQSTRLATLGQMEQSQALETTISLQNAFKLSGDELAKSINFLNMVENQTVVTLQDLSAAIPRVAPVIKGLGGDVEDLAAFLAAMQEGGVSAEQGANALKSGLASLINPTDKAKESLQGLGISLDTIIQANRNDLMGTVQAFSRALGTLDEFSRQQALEQVFGKFQYARLGALFDNITKSGSQASRVIDLAGMSAVEMAASAEKELSAIEESAGTKLVAAMERLKLAIAPIGELFVQIAAPIVNLLATIAEKFNNLPDGAKKFIGIATVITGLVIPAGTMFLGLLMNLVGTLVKFGNIVGLAFKGFVSGGFKGAFDNVSQALRYMSLEELDAVNAAQQLAGSTEAVNIAFTQQVGASEAATAGIMELAYAYEILTNQMLEAGIANELAFSTGVAAMGNVRGPRQRPQTRNKGGPIVPGVGNTDTVPAILTPGEFVVNKKATKENRGLLDAINSGQTVNLQGGTKEQVEANNPRLAAVARSSAPLTNEVVGSRSASQPQSQYLQITDMPDDLVRRINRSSSSILQRVGYGGDDLGFIKDFGIGVASLPSKLNNDLRSGRGSVSELISHFKSQKPLKELFDVESLGANQNDARKIESSVVKKLESLQKDGKLQISDADLEKIVVKSFRDTNKGSILKTIKEHGYKARRGTFLTGSGAGAAAVSLNMSGERGYAGFFRELGLDPSADVSIEKDPSRRRSTYLVTDNKTGVTYEVSPGRTPKVEGDYQRLISGRGKGWALSHFLRPRMRFNSGGQVPAMLTPGEYVVGKEATQKNKALLQAINNGEIKGYAQGGLVEEGTDTTGKKIYRDRNGNLVYGNRRPVPENRQPAPRLNAGQRAANAMRGFGGMKGMGVSMGMGMAGGAMMMGAGMVGESNPALGSAMSVGGTALSMASMLPMMAPMLAPVVGALGAIAVPAAAVVGALAAVGVGLAIWRKSVDGAATAAAEFGANIGGTANALNNMAEVLGTQTPAQARQKLNMGIDSQQAQEIANQFSGVFESGAGQKFIEDLQNSTSAERFTKLSDYLKSAIASGMMDQSAAENFAKAVGMQLGDSVLANQTVSAIKGQETGTGAMKEIADMRKAAVDADGSLKELAASSGEASLSNEAAGRAIGAATQIIQDYGNVIAVAEQQYAEGTIGWQEYHKAITESRAAQEEYTNVIRKSVTNAAEQGAARQALDQQMVAAGITQEAVDAITHATDIGISTLGGSQTMEGQKIGAVVGGRGGTQRAGIAETAYQKEFMLQGAQSQFGADFAQLSAEQQQLLSDQSKQAQDIARAVDLEGLNEAIKASVLAGEMTEQQAVQFGQAVMYDVDALKALEDGASIATAQFIMFSKNIPGLSKSESTRVTEMGKRFEALGGNIAQFENYIASVPENLRRQATQGLEAAGYQAGTRGRNTLSAEEQLRRQTDYMIGYQSLSQSIGAEQAVAVQKSAAGQTALAQQGGMTKLSDSFAAAVEGGVSENVIKYVIETEGAKNPEDMIKTMDGLTKAQQEIMSLPEEMIKGLKIDTTDPEDLKRFGAAAENLKNQWEIIKDLDPNIDMTAAMEFLTLDEKGNPLPPGEVANRVLKLNKAWKGLESGKPEVRKQAMIDIATAYAGQAAENGDVDPAAIVDKLREQFKDFDKLDPVTAEQMIQIQTNMEVLNAEDMAKITDLTAKAEAAIANGDLNAASGYYLQIAELQKGIKARTETAAAQLKTTRSKGSTGSKGGGGGGGAKSISETLKEQLDAAKKMFNQLQSVVNADAFKAFIAGPFAPEFLDYLRQQGDEGLKILKGGIAKIKAEYAKFQEAKGADIASQALVNPFMRREETRRVAARGRFTEGLAGQGLTSAQRDYVNNAISDEELARFNQLKALGKKRTAEQQNQFKAIQKDINRAKKQSVNAVFEEQMQSFDESMRQTSEGFQLLDTLAAKGIDPAFADTMTQMGVTSEMVAKMGPKAFNEMTAEIKRSKLLETVNSVRLALSNMGKDAQLTSKLAGMGFYGQMADDLRSAGVTAEMTAAQIKDTAAAITAMKIAADQAKDPLDQLSEALNSQATVQQSLIESYGRNTIQPLQDQLDKINEIIDSKQRDIDMEERKKDQYQENIDSLQEEQDKLQETYDARVDALDKVANINERIARQQQSQLDVASALSRGDIAGAAQAAMAAKQEEARASIEDARGALQAQFDAERTAIQDKIKTNELEIEAIDNRIKAIQDEIVKKQDEAYTKQQDINKAKKEQQAMEEKMYKLQLLQNILQQQRAITETARTGNVSAVQQQQQILSAQLGAVGNDPGAFFQGIAGGTDIAGAAATTAGTDAQTLINQALATETSKFVAAMQAAGITLEEGVPPTAANIVAAFTKAGVDITDYLLPSTEAMVGSGKDMVDNTALAGQNTAIMARITDQIVEGFQTIRARINEKISDAYSAVNALNAKIQDARNAAAAAAAAASSQKKAFGGRISYRGSNEKAPGFMYGGKMKKFAYGSTVPGIGMTDKVPALLTPGEFVVRKSVAQEYGPLLTAINSNVFPKMNAGGSMPKSSSNIKDGVQYNYSININVDETDSSADDIAKAVMYQIKRIEDRQVRGTRVG